MNFDNKTILITGANRGIGKALLEHALKLPVKKIYATARSLDSLAVVNDDRVVPLELDITNLEQVKKVAKETADVDLLLNNAGVATFTSILDGPLEAAYKDMETNYFGTVNMMREFVPNLKERPEAAIVNVTSIASFVNFPVLGGYCASKAALYSISQGIRIELANTNVTVHTVNPGPIDTDMAKDFEADKTSPATTAENIFNALKDGQLDIFPDPGGAQMFDVWNKDYRELESMVSQMHHSS